MNPNLRRRIENATRRRPGQFDRSGRPKVGTGEGNSPKVAIAVDPETIHRIDSIATELGVKRSVVVRALLDEGLGREMAPA